MEKAFYNQRFTLGENGNLHFDGADLAQIAKEFGAPAYVMSEGAIRENCRTFTGAMERNFGKNFKVAYASKAFCAMFLYPILLSEGVHADVVSGGELYTALKAGFPADFLHFHGNCKTDAELEYAVQEGIGSVVIDSFGEIERLNNIAGAQGKRVPVFFRVKPGIEAHTHESIQTGQNDSKFGYGIADGQAMGVAKAIAACKNLDFRGLHCHIGSQIFEPSSFEVTADIMIDFMTNVEKELGIELPELILGGGFGIRYMPEDSPVPMDYMIDCMAEGVKKACAQRGRSLPEVIIEPGRSMIGNTGVTLYTVGDIKDIKDARCYVAVDGGMPDNPRYALYQAQYDVDVVQRAGEAKDKVQTIAGRCCESGDLVSKDVSFQPARVGDTLCVYATGAYNYSMASNYNRLPRPPVVLITDGKAHAVVRRESYEDLTRNEIL